MSGPDHDRRDHDRWLRLQNETALLRERLEQQFREGLVLEQRLAELAAAAGTAPAVVYLDDPLPPLVAAAPVAEESRSDLAETPPALPPGHETWWPTGDRPPPPLVPHAGWACYSLQDSAVKVLGISVCGFGEAKIGDIVAMIAGRQRKARDFRPVFLTDSTAFGPFRRYNYVFEYFPAPDARPGPRRPDEWRAWGAARRELVMRKWAIAEIVQFGPRAFGE